MHYYRDWWYLHYATSFWAKWRHNTWNAHATILWNSASAAWSTERGMRNSRWACEWVRDWWWACDWGRDWRWASEWGRDWTYTWVKWIIYSCRICVWTYVCVCLVQGKEPTIVPGNNVSGALCIAKPWPGMARTVYGDHERFLDTYYRPYPGTYFTVRVAVIPY